MPKPKVSTKANANTTTNNNTSPATSNEAEANEASNANAAAPEPEPQNTTEGTNTPANQAPAAPEPVVAAPPPNPDPDERIPFGYWFLVGGTGPPPKRRNFIRMARERNAAAQKAQDHAAARKRALEERAKYLAEWEQEWGPVGAAGALTKMLGGNRQEKKR
ncbi:hypothetical protein M426DRAFT_12906 [Hypoxylon sp. CI-4A]|nr:hypothetical protein M426DRAFT_12906 [Hypoxylon sp. CI-4A]